MIVTFGLKEKKAGKWINSDHHNTFWWTNTHNRKDGD